MQLQARVVPTDMEIVNLLITIERVYKLVSFLSNNQLQVLVPEKKVEDPVIHIREKLEEKTSES